MDEHGWRLYNRGCRCDVCRADSTARGVRDRRKRAERLATNPGLAPHGDLSTYKNWDCRCDPCVEANKAACRAYKAKRRAA